MKDALEIDRRILGDENGTTLDTMSTLALYYFKDGQCALAEPLQRQVVEFETRFYGAQDSSTLPEVGKLAMMILLGSNCSRSRVNEALELARRAINDDPENSFLRTTLSLAEYRSGNWKEAIKAAGGPTEKDKDPWPPLHFLLAMAQWRNGDRTEALQNFSKGVEGAKNDAKPDFIQRAL